MIVRLVTVACALAAAVLAGCGGSADPRDAAVEGTTATVVVPRYEAAARSAAALRGSVDALCRDPSPAAVAAARRAWRTARRDWLATEASWIGPVMDRRSEGLVDWPADPARVEAALARARGRVDEDLVRSSATSARGLGALEHLLYADGAGTARRLVAEPRRCELARAVAEVVGDETRAVRDAWTTGVDGDPAYAETLAGRGPGAIDAQEAVEMLVERHLFLAQRISGTEIDASVGPGLTSRPEVLPEGAAGTGADDAASRLRGIRAAYTPGSGGAATLGDLLAGRDPDVHERLLRRLDKAIGAAEAIGGPLGADVNARLRLRDAIDNAEVTLATEVASVLGVTVGFSDNDGDSG